MNTMELIRTRRSIRTFDGRMISAEQREQLTEYIRTITNPYGIAVDFVLLDAKENGLSSPVIEGDTLYGHSGIRLRSWCCMRGRWA